MKKQLTFICDLVIIFLGLIMTSWIIWARFIRERMVRDIPDGLFTELRFWVILFVCFAYIFTVKNYIKPKTPHIVLLTLSELFYMPLIKFDRAIKYNKWTKSYHNRLMSNIIDHLYSYNRPQIEILLYLVEILPRFILISFLLLDTFYFFKLEIFYKVILIGLCPFIWRYILYCLKDFNKYRIELLEEKYNFVFVYEKGREFDISLQKEKPEYHSKKVSIKEYIEIQIENQFQHEVDENFPYKYTGIVFAKSEIIKNYRFDKYKNTVTKLTQEDYDAIDQLFENLIQYIIELKIFLDDLDDIRDTKMIKLPKIIIFSFYAICWSFILVICYWCYPVEFNMLTSYLHNLEFYLSVPDNLFHSEYGYSFMKNLITIENIILLLNNLFKNKL